MIKTTIYLVLIVGVSAFSPAPDPRRFRTHSYLSADPLPEADNAYDAFTAGSDLAFQDDKVGSGETIEDGDVLTVDYNGFLFSNKERFSKIEGLKFRYGEGKIMPGFEQGIQGMKLGGVRRLRIPPSLAYGEKGSKGVIPPNADLEFEISLKDIARGPIASNLALVGQNRAILLVILFAVSVFAPMIGIGEKGFI